MNHEIHENYNPTINNDFTIYLTVVYHAFSIPVVSWLYINWNTNKIFRHIVRIPIIVLTYLPNYFYAYYFESKLMTELYYDDTINFFGYVWLIKRKRIPHCQNTFKSQQKKHRKRQNRYPQHTNIWPLIFLAWYRHFNKSGRIKLVLWA